MVGRFQIVRSVAIAALVAAATLAGYTFASRRAVAADDPSPPLRYSGVLTAKDGTPLAGTHTIAVALFGAASGGGSLCTGGLVSGVDLGLTAGRFDAQIAGDCAPILQQPGSVWTEVSVDGQPLPRTPIATVPYALQATHADRASRSVAADLAVDAGHADVADRLQTSPWTLAPPGDGVDQYPTGAWGRGLEYRHVGDMTCLRGLLNVAKVEGVSKLATLPPGFRPADYTMFPATNMGTIVSVDVLPSGQISVHGNFALTAGWISFTGICFETAS